MDSLHPNLVVSPTKAHLRLFSVMRGMRHLWFFVCVVADGDGVFAFLTPLLLSFHPLHVLDSKTSSEDFVKYSRRSMRLLSEDALSEFPLQTTTVTTPCGPCPGVQALPADQICAVSIVRSGDCLLEVRACVCACVLVCDFQQPQR